MFLIVTAILIAGLLFFCSFQADIFDQKAYILLPEKKISLEVVKTAEDQTRGLSGKNSLPEDSAMLFVFNEPDYHGIWMKDMKFSIDILWLDASNKIIFIEKNISPQTYPKVFSPREKALYIVEAQAGFVEKNNLKTGDVLDVRL